MDTFSKSTEVRIGCCNYDTGMITILLMQFDEIFAV